MLGIEPLRAMLEFARMHFMDDGEDSIGDRHAVVLFPGLGADHRYMAPLAKYCERRGYACYDWGRGRNTGPTGDIAQWLSDLSTDIDAMVKGHRERVSLIGWSLGGLYAREVAKALPTRIRQVITLGTPFINVSGSTNVGWLYEMLNGGTVAIDPRLAKRLRTPPPVPTTSIYSRSDGVVAWKACVAGRGPLAENIEVDSSHLGLVWHPDVMSIVANRLAQREGNWTPWTEPERPGGGHVLPRRPRHRQLARLAQI
jgi:pimeloyl-ACP methyl ester carboxylesterase